MSAADRDREKILDQPLDVGLAPAVATLPARHDVLDLSVQELQELDVVGVLGFSFFCAIFGSPATSRPYCYYRTISASGSPAARAFIQARQSSRER